MHIRYAAEKGIAVAQYDLAGLYQNGAGREAECARCGALAEQGGRARHGGCAVRLRRIAAARTWPDEGRAEGHSLPARGRAKGSRGGAEPPRLRLRRRRRRQKEPAGSGQVAPHRAGRRVSRTTRSMRWSPSCRKRSRWRRSRPPASGARRQVCSRGGGWRPCQRAGKGLVGRPAPACDGARRIIVDARLSADERHDRRRPQGRAQPRPRLRRGRAAAGLGQGTRQLRLGRRPQGRGDHLPRAVEGAPRLLLPDGGARRGRRRRSNAIAGSSIRSTAPPTSCTACRCSPSPSGWSARASSSPASSTIPISDEMFTAEKGKGAFLNDRRRMRVAARKNAIRRAGDDRHPASRPPRPRAFVREIKEVIKHVAGVRRTGSAALDLAWIAAGRFDAYWERGIKPWDMAAGIVLVREAGGIGNRPCPAAPQCSTRVRCLPPTAPCRRNFFQCLRGTPAGA